MEEITAEILLLMTALAGVLVVILMFCLYLALLPTAASTILKALRGMTEKK